jgi:DNA polymerase
MTGSRQIVIDFETRGVLDVKRCGAAKLAEHPSTDFWCVCLTRDGQTVQRWVPGDPVPLEIIGACADSDCLFVAHNANFERTLWPLLTTRYGWPICPPVQRWRCTQAAALALALPPALGKLCKAIGLKHQKAADGIMHQMAKPRRPRGDEDPSGIYWFDDHEHREALYSYCADDVLAEWELYHWLPPLIPSEQESWCLDQAINDRGFYTDGVLIKQAIGIAKAAEVELAARFHNLTGLDSTNQVAKFKDWLAARDCFVADLQKPTLAAALRRSSLTPEVREAILLRKATAHSSANKFPAMQAWRCLDGRVHGTFNFHKAATGRWSAGGPQPQNYAREVDGIAPRFAAVMSGDIEQVKALGDPLEIIGSVSRAAICAAAGHKLLHADYSAIESRVLAWITDETSKLDLWAKFDATQDPADDPYTVIGLRMGFPPEEARPRGKRADLSFGFGGGIGAYWGFAPDDDTATDEQIRGWRDGWRAQHPNTVQFWRGIERAAVDAVRDARPVTYGRFTLQREEVHGVPFLFITLPGGRRLAYPFVRLVRDDYGRAAVQFMDNSLGGWQPCGWQKGKSSIWGGTFTENLVQAVARDRLASTMLRCEAKGFPIVLHMHDALVAEVPL